MNNNHFNVCTCEDELRVCLPACRDTAYKGSREAFWCSGVLPQGLPADSQHQLCPEHTKTTLFILSDCMAAVTLPQNDKSVTHPKCEHIAKVKDTYVDVTVKRLKRENAWCLIKTIKNLYPEIGNTRFQLIQKLLSLTISSFGQFSSVRNASIPACI